VEHMQLLGSLALGAAVVGTAIQLFYAYTLQVISDKQDQPGIVGFLAWVPLLNTYTFLRCGGGSLLLFLASLLGGGLLTGLVAFGAATAGGGLVKVSVGVVLAIVWLGAGLWYFGTLFWWMAERRELPGWVGLLCLIPGVNLIAFPYLAFHDGFGAPNAPGAVVGVLLAMGPLVTQWQTMQQLEALGGDPQALLRAAVQRDLGGLEVEPGGGAGEGAQPELERAFASMATMMELSMRAAQLAELDPDDPAQAARLREELADLRAEVDRADLEPDARRQIDQSLLELAEKHGLAAGDPAPAPPEPAAEGSGRVEIVSAQPEPPAARPAATAAPAAAAPPASPAPPTARRESGAGTVDGHACPAGTAPQGAPPPEGVEHWCARPGGERHGWYARWHDNAMKAVAGPYEDGQRHGVWTRWYPDGTLQARARFREGVQHGLMIAWNADGEETARVQYRNGEPRADVE